MAAAVLSDDSTIGRTIEFNNGDLPIAEALTTEVICTTQLVCRLRHR